MPCAPGHAVGLRPINQCSENDHADRRDRYPVQRISTWCRYGASTDILERTSDHSLLSPGTPMIKRQDAEVLYRAYERALGALTEAEAVLWNLPMGSARDECIRTHADVVVAILSRLRAPLVLEYPDLDTSGPEGPPDTLLEPYEEEELSRLTAAQVRHVDEAILASCVPSWKKVANVVGTASEQASDWLAEIPCGYFAQRVKALVQAGRLESQGNLDYMRFSEVRQPEQAARGCDPKSDG